MKTFVEYNAILIRIVTLLATMQSSDVYSYIEEGVKARNSIDVDQVLKVGRAISRAFANKSKLILMGNGGSAADSQHIAAEFVGRFESERDPLPAIALSTNSSSLTAISNDYSYENVFERQVKAFANRGDVVIGITTSGSSKNVVNGLKAARDKGCYCVALTGSSYGLLAECSDEIVRVSSTRTSIIQEVHIAIGHILSKIVENQLLNI